MRLLLQGAGLGLLSMLVKASEAADDAAAAMSRLRRELQQLLHQLWRQGRHG